MMLRALLLATAALTLQMRDAGKEIVVSNGHYCAHLRKDFGGFVKWLTLADGKTFVLGDHNIYTDYGLYAERGSVSSRNENAPKIKIDRDHDRIAISASGTLQGEVKEPGKDIGYEVTYVFDDSPTIRAHCVVKPKFAAPEARAFLATCFTTNNVEWAVRTQDGLLFGTPEPRTRRCFQSRIWPFDLNAPAIAIRGKGASLLISGFGRQDIQLLENVIIHGGTVFFAWLDGQGSGLKRKPLDVRFCWTIGRGDPLKLHPVVATVKPQRERKHTRQKTDGGDKARNDDQKRSKGNDRK